MQFYPLTCVEPAVHNHLVEELRLLVVPAEERGAPEADLATSGGAVRVVVHLWNSGQADLLLGLGGADGTGHGGDIRDGDAPPSTVLSQT